MDPPPHFANEQRPSRGAPQSSGSLLQRLPVELRLQIYDCLFPSKPVPYHGFDAGALRRDGQPSSTKVLRLSRAIHDEAEAYLYGRTTFEVRIHPAGIVLCGGRHMTFPEYDFGKRGGPDKIHGVPGAWKALLRNVRRLDLRITAWVQRDLFNMVCKYVAYFVSRLAADGAPLAAVRISVEWQNGVTNFPISRPTVDMAQKLLAPFAKLQGVGDVRFGRIDPLPVGFAYSTGYYSVTEDLQYAELKEGLERKMTERRTF
ncbi:hypothetical protein IWZ01DRAFT_487191 [Phyllosticta capitalensis]